MLREDLLLSEFSNFCRKVGLAESTFGRLAVNDGKFISRLRDGGRLTPPTLAKVRRFMEDYPERDDRNGTVRAAARVERSASTLRGPAPAAVTEPVSEGVASGEAERNFRFFDNRQKYLLFVNTCGEKWAVAERVGRELANLSPRPPALRLFDAGMGDGTVLTRVMRAMHNRFPTMPFQIVGKEISLEDVRLTLDKMADRFFEHPATTLVLTNLYYAEAPWLTPSSPAAARGLLWKEVALQGNSAHAFEEQLTELQSFLSEHWTARSSPKTGNPIYDRPIVLVLYREDHQFMLDRLIPRPGRIDVGYDLIIASQPYRARASAQFKASKVIAPLARALGPGGRLIGIHSIGRDPGQEIVRHVWSDDNPFQTDRHTLLKAVKAELGSEARHLKFNPFSDERSIFRYGMHALPEEVSGSIGTSTLFAAWNAAIYVSQVEDQRLAEAIKDEGYLTATDEVLKQHGGLWFNDESFVIARREALR